jgi:hypothetical protein
MKLERYWVIHMNSKEKSKAVTLKFIDCINSGDSEGLKALQNEDFTLIDMEGDEFVGRDGWEGYFADYPDYRIHVEKIMFCGTNVAIIGKTIGSHVNPKVEVLETVLWLADIENGLVSKWQIYSNLDEAKKAVGQI